MSKYWGYTAMWNLLDYPSITFPSGYTVDPNIDVKLPVEPRQNEFDAYIQSTYVPEEFRDAPIDVQLVARCWQDEELFASLRLIERTLGRSVDL
jgi:Asp-tRNA(Asn)/Glu-tRNA(Gln) amidotransferase A subunit family amidase